MSLTSTLVVSIGSYRYLEERLCRAGGFERGEVERKVFPDGERYLRLLTPVEGRDVVVVGGTIGEPDTTEVYDLASGVVGYGARTLTLVVPYFGYSTMERASKHGEVVTAKTRARLLSAVPRAYGGTHVVLLDLHTEGLQFYFEDGVHTTHLHATELIKEAALEAGGGDFVMACTDAGRAKRVESLANELGVPASFVIKRRLSGDRTEVAAVSAHVKDRKVVVYDDMIRTGGSLMGAARAYLDAGASEVTAIATHGLFPGDALDRIRQSGLFTKVVCTDSHPNAVALEDDFLEVRSVAPLLARRLETGLDGA
jgi:ribose-phosphate pyrophosphokinase